MTIDRPGSILPTPGVGAGASRPRTPEEAARQFEAVLVRQFVATMTKGLFEASLSSEEGPGWMQSQQDAQRDVLTDVLTRHLVESGTLRLSDLLLRRWNGNQAADQPTVSEEEKP